VVIESGSCGLIGSPSAPERKIVKDSPEEPKGDYPKSKIAAKKVLHDQHRKIPIMNQMQRIYEAAISDDLKEKLET
jgi:hypothetical protein